jgi:hypothetical protein
MIYLALGIFVVMVGIILFFTTRYFWLLLRPARRKALVLPRRESAPSHPLRTRLLELCHGDTALADRLYLHASRHGKSVDWNYQKAIDDLIRDRN